MSSLFVDNLTVIDCALLDYERGLIGASWIVDLVLDGSLDEQGMLVDFGTIKSTIKRSLDQHIDHKLLVAEHTPGLRIRQQLAQTVIEFTTKHGEYYRHSSPDDAICSVPGTQVDCAAVIRLATALLRELLPDSIDAIRLNLRNEAIAGVSYCYVHGLKQHAGNCQRIAHGHRSGLHITVNGRRVPELESVWADRWRDIYLASEADLSPYPAPDNQESYRYAYQAEQGNFELILPKSRCYVIDTQTTVEHLAAHLCQAISVEHPGDKIEVRAFEGVGKGAVAVTHAD